MTEPLEFFRVRLKAWNFWEWVWRLGIFLKFFELGIFERGTEPLEFFKNFLGLAFFHVFYFIYIFYMLLYFLYFYFYRINHNYILIILFLRFYILCNFPVFFLRGSRYMSLFFYATITIYISLFLYIFYYFLSNYYIFLIFSISNILFPITSFLYHYFYYIFYNSNFHKGRVILTGILSFYI